MRRRLRLPLLLIALAATLSLPVYGQESSRSGVSGVGWNGWGLRVGVSSDPDQIHGGVHFELGEFARDVRFRPSIEIGFGDDATVLQGLAEAHFVFSKVQVWKPYVGGGLGITYIDVDNSGRGDDTETDVALMAIGGIETKLRSATRLFFELKIGFGDEDPDVKLGVGWGWK